MNMFVQLGILIAGFLLAYNVRFGWVSLSSNYLIVLLLGLLLAAVIFPATGAFRQEFRWASARKLRRLLAGWAIVISILVVLAALFKVTSIYSRIWFSYWVLFGAIGIMLGELISHQWLKQKSRLRSTSRSLVLVGAGAAAARVEERLNADPTSDYRLVARFGEAWSEQAARPLDELAEYVNHESVDDVWIAAPFEDSALLEKALDVLSSSLVNVHVVPDLYQYRLLNQHVIEWQGLPIISLSDTPMTGAEWRLKAAMDKLGAAFLILVGSPLLFVIGFAVRISSPGPVIFRQLRHGIGGEVIKVLKFRTMKVHSEPGGKISQAKPGDERVTRVGSLLRGSSLDELPQLFNVLKGEMSLVGPRPHALEHNEYYLNRIPKYMLRHKAKPGITGWAQINGLRGITETEEKMSLRIEHDLWYIQNWSIWLDLQILMRTPFAMVGRNVF
jgi:Undecaprenyl-phosphate glucose phosphotransferase